MISKQSLMPGQAKAEGSTESFLRAVREYANSSVPTAFGWMGRAYRCEAARSYLPYNKKEVCGGLGRMYRDG